jgi:stage II sporulation protein R
VLFLITSNKTKKSGIKVLEYAMAAGLVLSVLIGAYAHATQQGISEKLIRLHVVADSDTAEDQSVKLKVRDRVLEKAQAVIDGEKDVKTVYAKLNDHLSEIEASARDELLSLGRDDSVRAELKNVYFPTRDYESFSLPPGNYTTLNVVIGSGQGKNWWCVVFPPLCMTAAEDFDEAAQAADLTPEEVKLITEDGGEYQFKFKIVEIFESIF